VRRADRLNSSGKAVRDHDRSARRRLEVWQLESILEGGEHLADGRLRQHPARHLISDAAHRTLRLAVREVRADARHAERVMATLRGAAETHYTRRQRRLTRRARITPDAGGRDLLATVVVLTAPSPFQISTAVGCPSTLKSRPFVVVQHARWTERPSLSSSKRHALLLHREQMKSNQNL